MERRYITQWAGTSLEYKEDTTVIKAEIDSISPHQVHSIEGDGHCFFRAISKAVTGTQDFHSDFRKAVVAWMLLEDHPQQLGQYVLHLIQTQTQMARQLSGDTLMSHACHEMDGVGTKRYVPLQPCFKLKYVCQTTPLEGEGGMFTHPFSQCKDLQRKV